MLKTALVCIISLLYVSQSFCQMITGTWKGKINRQKVEVKIIQQGDSLTGTSYYYESPSHYRRYAIKGYFDANTNEAVWWDDKLIEVKDGRVNIGSPGRIPLLSSADFNCPGSGKMLLDGKSARKDNPDQPAGEVHLDKTTATVFSDEWDFVIDNFLSGANDPDIIDSVSMIAYAVTIEEEFKPQPPPRQKETTVVIPVEKEKPAPRSEMPKIEIAKPVEPVRPLSIEEKFVSRKKILTSEIPLTGDSIELRFYDNAQIDGDSISLFLNDKLIFQHIRLTGSAYTIKLSVSELQDNNELIMVAENLGAIPPNTSYMTAQIGEKRYEARLESTEGSSAMIRLFKEPKK
jgi:hypothetical protein